MSKSNTDIRQISPAFKDETDNAKFAERTKPLPEIALLSHKDKRVTVNGPVRNLDDLPKESSRLSSSPFSSPPLERDSYPSINFNNDVSIVNL